MKRNADSLFTAKLLVHFMMWLTQPEAQFLNGRFVWANWDVEELKARGARDRIEYPYGGQLRSDGPFSHMDQWAHFLLDSFYRTKSCPDSHVRLHHQQESFTPYTDQTRFLHFPAMKGEPRSRFPTALGMKHHPDSFAISKRSAEPQTYFPSRDNPIGSSSR